MWSNLFSFVWNLPKLQKIENTTGPKGFSNFIFFIQAALFGRNADLDIKYVINLGSSVWNDSSAFFYEEQ